MPSSETATSIGVAQLTAVLPLLQALGVCILIVLDRGYSSAPWVQASHRLPTAQLIRARADRVLYRPPLPRRPHQRGPSPLDGHRFKGTEPATHPTPDADWTGTDGREQPVQVTAWCNLHLQDARQVPITVIRVIRMSARGTKRDPRVSWFWWLGGPLPPLQEIPGLYARRFGQEHGYRFDKQELLWATPQLRTPEQFERWTDVVSLVHNQLVLAQPLVEAVRKRRRLWRRQLPRDGAGGQRRLDAGSGHDRPQPRAAGLHTLRS